MESQSDESPEQIDITHGGSGGGGGVHGGVIVARGLISLACDTRRMLAVIGMAVAHDQHTFFVSGVL